ncbi:MULTISPECIES: hypothetical protein [unclassified Endozoicomonas]|uniref:hypothetical protein n=1 Tax=unclassified Endozoicomonas TaxID=2644528 RepID=UPI002147FD30|nr:MULTISPECIES: hypothetical protein [unclassified Endozoicomonas]
MSLNAEQPPETELDHIRDTLTGIVSYASKTRGEMHRRFDQQEKRFDERDKRFDHQDKAIAALKADNAELKADIVELKADNVEIKGALKLILSRLPS